MEKYDTIIKLEEIRKLTDSSQYKKAQKIIDTIDLHKIKSLPDLSIIADILIQNERYDEATSILNRMYSKTKARRILYQLVEVSIKRGNIEEAEENLDKYLKAAPNDFYQFIFRYCIDKRKGEPYEVLIHSLEQLKEYEYIENWAYELAKLYHKAGMKDKCIRECSDIALWFGEGLYVEKAKLLKSYYIGEIDPVHMLNAKEKREAEIRLGLDKTKDYSSMREQIDQLLAEDEAKKKMEERNQDSVQPRDNQHWEDNQRCMSKEEMLEAELLKSTSDEDINAKLQEMILDNDSQLINQKTVVEEENTSELESNINEEEESFPEQEYDQTEEEESNPEQEYELTEEESILKQGYDQTEEERNIPDQEFNLTGQKESIPEQDYNLAEEIESIQQEELTLQYENSIESEELINYLSNLNIDYGKILGYYNQIKCKHNITASLGNILKDSSKSKHLIISGNKCTGKTTLAKRISKILYATGWMKSSSVAKINAAKLNRINLLEKEDKLKDATLVIEEAGCMNSNTVQQLLQLLTNLRGRIFTVLEDTTENIDNLMNAYPVLRTVFLESIELPEYTFMELLGFANYYIEEYDYQLTPEASAKLKDKINEIMNANEGPSHLSSVLDIIKKVKLAADERNIAEMLTVVGSRKMNATDFLYVTEEDFWQLM